MMFSSERTTSVERLFGLACLALSLACGSGSGSHQPPAGQRDAGFTLDGSVIEAGAPPMRAIVVSVDAMGAVYVRAQLAAGKLPRLGALAQAGAFTLNARADYDFTVTLPNHTSMLTGRPVEADPDLPADAYHGWTINALVDSTTTLHNSGNPNLSYVASAFDVAHDHGRRTCLYAGKLKFMLFANSYGARYGAPDGVGEDNGRNKIDRVVILEKATEQLIAAVESDLAGGACDFAFIHIPDLDVVGHASGWGGEEWLATLDLVDEWIGRIARFASPEATGSPYALVVTADHGGNSYDHSDTTLPLDYTIPFFVVAPGLGPNTDLYALAGPRRLNPGDGRPRNSGPSQPIRNGDAGNTALALMGLPPIPGSLFRGLLETR